MTKELTDLPPSGEHQTHESSADRLLRRRASTEYLAEWEAFVGKAKEEPATAHICGTVIFRIARDYLAIPTAVVGQVADLKPIHRIPHQRGKTVQGIVNINGQLRLFVSMMNLLEIGTEHQLFESGQKRSMMVIEKDSEVWAFAVTEVCGIHYCDLRELHNVPVNVAKSTANYFKGVFYWNDHNVGFLDDELLFFSLRKCLL